jgi:hypothetical protein
MNFSGGLQIRVWLNERRTIITQVSLMTLGMAAATLHGCNVNPADSPQWNDVCNFVNSALLELEQDTIPPLSPNSNRDEHETILRLTGQDFKGFTGIEAIDYEFGFYMMYLELESGALYYCCVEKLDERGLALVSLEPRTERVEKYRERGAQWKVDCGNAP